MMVPRSSGVEEKKEDDVEGSSGPVTTPKASRSEENDEQERTHGFQAQVAQFATAILGSCGSAIEAASISACAQWKGTAKTGEAAEEEKAPLSIAEELRKLAAKEGRPYPLPPPPGPRAADIPKFLGEDAVHSFEDDNISAISAHTLEELVARNGIMHPASQRIIRHQQRRASLASIASERSEPRPPSPTRTTSLSSHSSKDKQISSPEMGA